MPAPAPRKIRVLVLHLLGANSVAMRSRIDPIMAALPPHVRERFELVTLDGPCMMPALDKVSINDKDGVGVGFERPQSQAGSKTAAAATAVKPPSGSGSDGEERSKRLGKAMQAISYWRCIEAELWADANRSPPRAREDLQQSVETAKKWLAEVEGDAELMREAEERLSQPAQSSKEPRWFFIRSQGAKGEWIGHEYLFAWMSEQLRRIGPIDGCICASSGSILAYYLQALLCGGIPASQEPTWRPPPHQKPFRFMLTFCPFFPPGERYPAYFESVGRYVDSLASSPSQAQHRSLLVHGNRDKISTAADRDLFAQAVRAQEVWLHEGGHTIPTKEQAWCDRLAAWLQDAVQTSCGVQWDATTQGSQHITARL